MKCVKTMQVMGEYKAELQTDFIIRRYVASLADKVLEKDISRFIQAYSIIEVFSLFHNP